MTRRWSTFSVSLLIAFGLPSLGVRAWARPADLDYAHRPSAQRMTAKRWVNRLVWPTVISPVLVRQGGKFELLLRVQKSPAGRLIVPGKPPAEGWRQGWMVFLLTPEGTAYPCELSGWHLVRAERKGMAVVALEVQTPPFLARDVYDIRVVAPGLDDTQPNAVRVFGPTHPRSFRFAVMTDHQLWDPSFKIKGRALHADSYPRKAGPAKRPNNEAITLQGMREIALWDPAFVLHTGDLVFGLNFPREYEQARRFLREARLPVFGIPGNHDGYAIYTLRLKASLVRMVTGAVQCRKKLTGELTWAKAWAFIGCFYGDVKERLFVELQQDGLAFWRRSLGPTEYVFEHGRMRFIAINTYAGTPERRHAFSIYMDAFDLHLGAPAVDNYGGYMTDAQIARLKRELEITRKKGMVPVVFGHHDPRGNREAKERYHPNEPFPTSPLGLGSFEEWNYDAESWDSDANDTRSKETPQKNSALAVLKLLAEYGGYYLSGHVHADGRTSYAKGSKLGPYPVQRPLELIRTTSAASSVKPGAYWGYRLFEVRGDRIVRMDYSPKRGLGSIPAGNLWSREIGGGNPVREIVSALPKKARVTVRWALPHKAAGYRFRLGPAADSLDPLHKAAQPLIKDIADNGKTTTFWVQLELPPAPWPPKKEKVRFLLSAVDARDNRPPVAKVGIATVHGTELQDVVQDFHAAPGQGLLLSAEGSRDDDGDRIISYTWDFGDGRAARGQRVTHVYQAAGDYSVTLRIQEETGVVVEAVRLLRIQKPKVPSGCEGCCVPVEGQLWKVGAVSGVLLLGLFAAWTRRRRRKNGTKR